MALTAYCKKCAREVPPGEICPRCGAKLGRNAAHAAWCLERTPVKDWMHWNAVMRILLPASLLVLLLVLLFEGLAGGAAAVEALLGSGFLLTLGLLLLAVVMLVFLALWLQGPELSDFVVDSRGVHETRYLTNPTALKLLLRLKSPRLLSEAEESGEATVLRLDERHLPWREVARVQLWSEKCMVLFYAPGWWLRIPVRCTPFTWEDTLGFIREKLGKKKKVLLPATLVVAPPPSRSRAKPIPRPTPEIEEALEQLRTEERTEAMREPQPEPQPEPLPADSEEPAPEQLRIDDLI